MWWNLLWCNLPRTKTGLPQGEGALEIGTFKFSEDTDTGVSATSLTGELKVFYFSDEG